MKTRNSKRRSTTVKYTYNALVYWGEPAQKNGERVGGRLGYDLMEFAGGPNTSEDEEQGGVIA